jgi:nitrogen fixation/metabolism regulation signal transduction histidine kinase
MGFKYFALLLAVRIGLLTVMLAGSVYLFLVPGYPMLQTLLGLGALLLLVELLRFVQRTNTELVRFLDAVRYGDFGQRFQMPRTGAGFEELGEALTDIVAHFQHERAGHEASLRHLQALTEHVPVPLLSLYPDAHVQLHNNAARRLFGSVQVNRCEDLAQFGDDFTRGLVAVVPGERRLVVFLIDDLEQRLIVSATELVLAGTREKLISLQNIQSELDGAQLQAWQDLVRVLTHEIMNSITPVASLARTASDLVDDAAARLADAPEVAADLADVKRAVETVARRSDGLMQFVQSYRRLTRLPAPDKQTFPVPALFASVQQLIASEWQEMSVDLRCQVDPPGLVLDADRDMVEQVLLNLLQNAGHALAGRPDARVDLKACLGRHGRVMIEVADNGPGVAPEIAGRIFVPFFTTRREGSGVGLALTRQVMLAHGGNAVQGESDSGGARFTLTF